MCACVCVRVLAGGMCGPDCFQERNRASRWYAGCVLGYGVLIVGCLTVAVWCFDLWSGCAVLHSLFSLFSSPQFLFTFPSLLLSLPVFWIAMHLPTCSSVHILFSRVFTSSFSIFNHGIKISSRVWLHRIVVNSRFLQSRAERLLVGVRLCSPDLLQIIISAFQQIQGLKVNECLLRVSAPILKKHVLEQTVIFLP